MKSTASELPFKDKIRLAELLLQTARIEEKESQMNQKKTESLVITDKTLDHFFEQALGQ